MAESRTPTHAPPWTRVVILCGTLLLAGYVSHRTTGSIIPTGRGASLIFQSGILLVVLGSALIEHKFTRPADSVVNSLAAAVTLVTVYGVVGGSMAWWLVLIYCLVVLALSLTCTVVSTGPDISGWKRTLAGWTYAPAVYFGRARIIFSIVFLFGVFAFYESGSREAAILVAFWGFFVALWPLQLPQLLARVGAARQSPESLGHVVRREWPDLLRIELKPNVEWDQRNPYLHQDADGVQHLVVPLYKQVRSDKALGTGLAVRHVGKLVPDLEAGFIYALPTALADHGVDINAALGAPPDSTLIGFVIEDSNIGAIKLETWRPDVCREGLLVWCDIDGRRIYYQITQGFTREESIESDRLGSQYALAAQVGSLREGHRFVNHDWLPTMNTPVFAEHGRFGADIGTPDGDFIYGHIPGTQLAVSGPFVDALDFHTAVLGVTGSGKTELTFDLIRHALAAGVNVMCIDLTARYEQALVELAPRNLSLSAEAADELSKRLFAVETGQYGAGEEKKALQNLRSTLYEDIKGSVAEFSALDVEGSRLGLITLDEISNTKATLVVTELFMTSLLHYARDNSDNFRRTLVVVEEAHTVMPESSTMGLGDFESRGLVGKISQIALQGRKYGVGLLVVAQRTATVSKTVLTQCNTVIALTSFDETTVGFLSNVYGRAHADALRELAPLQAVVFGKGVRSDRPVIVEIPYRPEKDTGRLILDSQVGSGTQDGVVSKYGLSR